MKKFILAVFLSALVMPSVDAYARRVTDKKTRKTTIDLAAAHERVAARSKDLMKCFNSFIPDKFNPAPSRVQIWVELEVAPNGKVVASSITSSTVSDTKPEKCMENLLAGLTYPKPSNGASSSLIVKMTFRRGSQDMLIKTY